MNRALLFLVVLLFAGCDAPRQERPELLSAELVAPRDASAFDDEPSNCYAGRVDYRTACRDARLPWKYAFDETCVSEPAKRGALVGYGGGGVPFLAAGYDPNWPSALSRFECAATPAANLILICCP